MKRLVVAGLALLVLALVAAELLLPGMAESRARRQLERVGAVGELEVSSFPAVKLVFGDVDEVRARLEEGNVSRGEVADLIAMTEGVDRLRVDAVPVTVSGLRFRSGRLVMEGGRVHAEGILDEKAIAEVLPAGARLRDVSSSDGTIRLDGSFSLFGLDVADAVTVAPRDGAIVATPEGLPLVELGAITLFSDGRVPVDALGAREAGRLLRLSADARLVER